MNRKIKLLLLCAAAALILCGCGMRTVDELYRVPKRSDEFHNLQSAIDGAMGGMDYCAPLTGENRQTVQRADLDGDGEEEYLLFAKSGAEKPLQILIFSQREDSYVLSETIGCSGSAFDQVEYAQMDGQPGLELIVGRQVSEQVLRSVSVYTFSGGQHASVMTANYTKFLTCDLDGDQLTELMILRPGEGSGEKGVSVLYGMENGVMERSQEVGMSEPVDNLKRILTGKLHGGMNAVYVGCSAQENAIITDVYALVDGVFTNVSLSNESGTSVQTLRNHFVYADDIDDDGVVELPRLITMQSVGNGSGTGEKHLIRWYAMTASGEEVDKMFTYHDFLAGWYLQLNSAWAERITVEQSGGGYEFYLWDISGSEAEKIFTVYAFSGTDRDEKAAADNHFVLLRTESTVYAAHMEVASGTINITQDDLMNGFHLISQDWKTGET